MIKLYYCNVNDSLYLLFPDGKIEFDFESAPRSAFVVSFCLPAALDRPKFFEFVGEI